MSTGYEYGMWRTADGADLRIVDMGENHLDNAIAFLERWLAAPFNTTIEVFGMTFEIPRKLISRREKKLAELRAERARRDELAKLRSSLVNAEAELSRAIHVAYKVTADAAKLAACVREFQQASMIESDDVTPAMVRGLIQDLGDALDTANTEVHALKREREVDILELARVTKQCDGWKINYECALWQLKKVEELARSARR